MWKFLVADDNVANRQLLAEILRGYAKCDMAGNGREAMTAYQSAVRRNAPYDLVLLDVAMPEVNGIEFLKQVRALENAAGVPPGKGIPIIMVTAFDHPFIEAFDSGCDDYILKPIDGLKLLEKIKMKLE